MITREEGLVNLSEGKCVYIRPRTETCHSQNDRFAQAIAMESWFFLGGALMCALTGYRHWTYSRKQALPPQPG
jgi:hypothetical protein